MTNAALQRDVSIRLATPADYLAGMRLYPAGCTVIATRHGDTRAGLTATAVCSVTAEPPRLLVCINRKVAAHAMIVASGALSVNLLALSQQHIAKRFAGMIDGVAGEARFDGDNWSDGASGAPVLQDALTTFDCIVGETIEASSHSVFLCDVVAVTSRNPEELAIDPLIYFNGSFSALKSIANDQAA